MMSSDGPESGDEDSFMDTALVLDANAIGKYDTKDLPINGHQYVHKVMKEAGTLPQIVVAALNMERFQANQTVYVPELETFEIPKDYLPTEIWQACQVEDFERVRNQVSKMRSRLPTCVEGNLVIPDYTSDDEEWLEFWKKAPPEPSLQDMLAFNQASLDVFLKCLSDWLELLEDPFDARTCLWVYSALACLEIPLLPSTFSSLRTVAQMAIKKRAELVASQCETAKDHVIKMNLLICIVGRYFKQIDLADKY